ncbi:hypothetical protein N8I77_008661 [Diaporthe amygdali]|uniref:Uncharacterized protein n=1 Tax=Phomopsis amygdali TaxID=1214568 RepID=A0AAD9S9C0_PHOAM|nr:hypothetical protein N8I77_008661 [Diaporthe amygdali]
MASSAPFHKFLWVVVWVGLGFFSVAAKPIGMPALGPHRYISNVSNIMNATGTLYNEGFNAVEDHPPATSIVEMPVCIDDDRCASGCMITDAPPKELTLTCTTPSYCSLKGVGATHSCHSQGIKTAKSKDLDPIPTVKIIAPFSPSLYQEHDTPTTDTEQPGMISAIDTTNPTPSSAPAPSLEEQVTITMKFVQTKVDEPGGQVVAPDPTDVPDPVPGQQTVYITLSDDPDAPTAIYPSATAPAKAEPDYTNDPEPNKAVIILGSIFGFMAAVGLAVVSVDRLRKRRREKRQELQESQQGHHDSISSAEDISELLRQQQQTYGYYGTQRIASGGIVPQQVEILPASTEPAELPSPKEETVEKERRDDH